MIKLVNTLEAWGNPDFEAVVKNEIKYLDKDELPLQQGLTQSSQVSDGKLNIIVLDYSEEDRLIRLRTGIFYSGVIAGSCCADDPTPMDELTEYCEMEFMIDKNSAETSVILLSTG